ncbi:MAG: efflux RND transporter periplasmic adaptor subunit [Acidobacteria bacterium]|nr:efflux RND transporter periplasmic adaptor subunit [Acidobacteriota bacterium]
MRLSIAACCLSALTACRSVNTASPPAESAPVRVQTLRIEPRTFASTVPVTGTLVSPTRVEVKAETIGRVVKVAKEEGDSVAAGEPIVWLDPVNYELAVAQANSAVKVAEAALAKAEVAERHAASELERARNLLRSGGITDKDLKSAQVAGQEGRAQVELAQAQLAQARVSAETARKHVRDTVIPAPVGGQVARRHVSVGSYVEAPTAVFTLVDNGRLELEALVPTSDLASIRARQSVTFTVNSYSGMRFRGSVIEVSPAVDAEARTAKVRIAVDASGGKLRAGLFAEGEILTGSAANAILVPIAAVYRDDRSSKQAYLFVVMQNKGEPAKAFRRAIRIGAEKDNLLQVLEGLQAGEVVVAEQSIEVADGVRIEVK